MLLFRRRSVTVVPIGGLALLVLLGVLFVHGLYAGEFPVWGLSVSYGGLGLLVLAHVSSSAMWVGVRSEQLRWWGLFGRGAHELQKCRLILRTDEGVGRGALICVELHRGARDDEPVELASLALSDSNRARALQIAEQLGLEIELDAGGADSTIPTQRG